MAAALQPAFADLREQFLQIERLRSGARRRQNAFADFVAHRADQSATQAGFFANVFDQKCRRGFAVRAGHAASFNLRAGYP